MKSIKHLFLTVLALAALAGRRLGTNLEFNRTGSKEKAQVRSSGTSSRR